MKDAECSSAPGAEEDEEDELSPRQSSGMETAQAQLSDVPPSEFSMEPPSSPGEEEGGPLEGPTDRPVAGGRACSLDRHMRAGAFALMSSWRQLSEK